MVKKPSKTEEFLTVASVAIKLLYNLIKEIKEESDEDPKERATKVIAANYLMHDVLTLNLNQIQEEHMSEIKKNPKFVIAYSMCSDLSITIEGELDELNKKYLTNEDSKCISKTLIN